MNKLLNKLLNTEAKQIGFSFFMVIFTGSVLLTLPISQLPHSEATYIDNLFTSVSMVCVTGLFTSAVSETYNTFGQVICMMLMQIGGLGLMSLMSLSIFYFKKNVSLKDQYLLQSTVNRSTNYKLKKFIYNMVTFTVTVELICTLLLSTQLIPMYGFKKGFFSSVFIAISAFNNAGFDNLGATSLINFQTNAMILLPIAFSIIFAGIGFSVWFEIRELIVEFHQNKPNNLKLILRKMSIHSRVVLITTFFILLVGTVLSWAIEAGNKGSIGTMSLTNQLLNSFFQTVSMRTAGFASLNYDYTHFSTNLLYILQMIIGGSPGGTAGGIKVTTFVIIIMYIRAELRGNKYISVFKRTISMELFRRVMSVFFFYMLTLITGWLLILIAQPELDPFKVLFECVSALSTVGVTVNLTGSLSIFSQFVIMALMFLGRVGPLTVFMSLSILQHKNDNLRYAEADLLIG